MVNGFCFLTLQHQPEGDEGVSCQHGPPHHLHSPGRGRKHQKAENGTHTCCGSLRPPSGSRTAYSVPVWGGGEMQSNRRRNKDGEKDSKGVDTRGEWEFVYSVE